MRRTSRRDFIRTTATGAVGLALSSAWSGCAVVERIKNPDPYRRLDSDQYLGKVQIETRVAGDNVFLEGPAVASDGRVFFTNVSASQILVWNPRFHDLGVFRSDSHMANGLTFDGNGALLVCEGETGSVSRINVETGRSELLVDAFEGRPLEAPNDLFVDALGRIYFSSRPGPAPSRGSENAVFRRDPDGTLVRLLAAPQVQMPNGVVTSPDESVLYLVESDSDAERNRCIKAFDLDDDGNISNESILYDFYPGRSGDGMCVDREGNLYVAAGLHALRGTSETLDTLPGIHVISPGGVLLAYRETPIDSVTNCTFGGLDLKTLYVTCGNLLLSMPTGIAGADFYRREA